MEEQSDIHALLNECRTIAENCLYTAQAHYVMANKTARRNKLLVLFPACIAGISGFLTAFGMPEWIGAFSAISGTIIAVASYLGIGEKEMSYKMAANQMTILRHEARAIYETFWNEMTRDQLVCEIKRVGDRYNTLCQVLEITDKDSYEEASRRIKSGAFEPEFRNKET